MHWANKNLFNSSVCSTQTQRFVKRLKTDFISPSTCSAMKHYGDELSPVASLMAT